MSVEKTELTTFYTILQSRFLRSRYFSYPRYCSSILGFRQVSSSALIRLHRIVELFWKRISDHLIIHPRSGNLLNESISLPLIGTSPILNSELYLFSR